MAHPSPDGILDLTEAMLRGNDPPPLPPPLYSHREVKVITTKTGGFGVVVGQELVGVAEGPGRLGTLIAEWAKGG